MPGSAARDAVTAVLGLSVEETAEGLDGSPRSVKRDWALARAWLFRRLNRQAR